MKFTLSWLKDHLQTSASASQIAETLTRIGIEVEERVDLGRQLEGVIVAKIIQTEKHPHADRLRVCQVDTGNGVVEVVCGAPNARPGLVTAFVAPGTVVPSTGEPLKLSTIRQIQSYGMLCSSAELCLGASEEGIMELPQSSKAGTPLATALHLDDTVFTVSITPNRSDCLSVRGIARDLAAAGLGTLQACWSGVLGGKGEIQPTESCQIGIEIEPIAAAACSFFAGRMIEAVKNEPSPPWMQRRLQAIGLTPISALVDIGNYVMYDMGHPLHIFDGDKIKGNLTVDRAREGEELHCLNGKNYQLKPNMLVVRGGKESTPLSLAGIMGGAATGCSPETTRIFIESAYFKKDDIAATGRELNILSDARYRFERGTDPACVLEALHFATRLVLDLCGGQASTIVSVGDLPLSSRGVRLSRSKLRAYNGSDISEAPCILKRLGFTVEPYSPWLPEGGGVDEKQQTVRATAGDDVLEAIVPSWRHDIAIEADLIEEVIRIHGYDKIVPTPLPLHHIPTRRTSQAAIVRRALASRGLFEAATWSFISPAAASLFHADIRALTLLNPISGDMAVMRPNLLPNLLSACRRNFDRNQNAVALFEVESQYASTDVTGQQRVAAGVRAGSYSPPHWASSPRNVDVFDVKADILSVIQIFGIHSQGIRFGQGQAAPWYHPGRSASVITGKNTILGYFGEVHPEVLHALDLEKPCFAFELFLQALPEFAPKLPRSSLTLNPLLPIERDFAFIVERRVAVEALLRAVKKVDRHITDVTVFDIYEGKGIEQDHKSIGIRVSIQPQKTTLTDQDIQNICQSIISHMEKTWGGRLRG